MARPWSLCVLASLCAAQVAHGEDDDAALAKAAQNPIASLITIPIQLNFNGSIGPFDRTQTIVDIQPVIPVTIAPHVTLVTRWILPLVGQPDAAQSSGTTWGVGDFNSQIYVGIQVGDFTIGPGVTVVAPTATDAVLGAGKLSLGPAFVGVYTGGLVVAGFLINNAWSIAGADARTPVDQMFLQPFFTVNFSNGTSLVTSPQMTFDWEGKNWTVPIGGGVSQLVSLGGLRVNFGAQAYWNAVTPAGGPEWTLRVQMQFLFPLPKKK
jgi:hypothetical protein